MDGWPWQSLCGVLHAAIQLIKQLPTSFAVLHVPLQLTPGALPCCRYPLNAAYLKECIQKNYYQVRAD